MANYILYHPKGIDGYVPPQHKHSYMYCTDVMMLSLQEVLIENNHSVEIQYIDVWESEEKHLINFNIPELDLNVVGVPSSLWFLVANKDTNKFVVVDLQDSPALAFKLNQHKNLIFALIGQFSIERYIINYANLDFSKMLPFVYCAYYPIHTREMRMEIQEIRKNLEKLDDRLFFYGNNLDTYNHSDGNKPPQKIREVISVLSEKYPDESCVGSWADKLPMDDWFRKAATHTISLALPGHPWCSREHELWTLGLPVMMYEHTHKLAVDLIPNYHYISSAAGDRLYIGMAKDPEFAADQLIKTHREWIKPENRWRLNLIAQHGQQRMDKYASPEVIGKKLTSLLELGHW